MIKRALTTLLIMLFISITAASNVAASSAPKISGPELIQKEQFKVLTIADIIALYSSNIGAVTVQEDSFTGKGSTLGVHEIDLIASNGEEQVLRTIQVEVLPTIGHNVRAVTDRINIHVSKADILLPVNIIQIHSRTGVFNLHSSSQFELLTDNYTENAETPGSYLLEYRIMDATGMDKTVSCRITVHASERITGPVFIFEREPGFFDKLGGYLNTIVVIGAVMLFGFIGYRLFIKGRKKT